MYWPEEDCVSIVDIKNIIEPCPPILNKQCNIKTGTRNYTGVLISLGRFIQTVKNNMVDLAHEILEILFPLIGSKSDIELKENNFWMVWLMSHIMIMKYVRMVRDRANMSEHQNL